MIAWNYERENDDQERLDAFAKAVFDGAMVIAGPETARRLNDRVPVLGVQPNEFVPEGTVYAIDCSQFGMFPPLDLTES